MEEPSWFGLPGRRAPAVPLFQGRLSLKSPAARREGCSRPPPSSPTELPKDREINRDPARERERARERASESKREERGWAPNIAKNNLYVASREIIPTLPALWFVSDFPELGVELV